MVRHMCVRAFSHLKERIQCSLDRLQSDIVRGTTSVAREMGVPLVCSCAPEHSNRIHTESVEGTVERTVYHQQSREPPDEIPEIKMAGPTRVVLLACGSYNPVTNMHLRMFELARDTLQRSGKYKVIGGIISPVNDAYKKKDLVVAKHRIAMLKQALKSSDWIKLDTWESEQDCWLETKKVLDHHRANLDTIINANITENTIVSPTKRRRTTRGRKVKGSDDVDYTIPENLNLNNLEGGPIQLRLLCGADLLESFAVPGLWADDDIEDIVCKYGLVCITRGGSNPQKFIYDHDVLTEHQHNIVICNEWITNEVSATKIRRSLRRRESVKYLMPDSVISYIKEHGLYATAPSSDNKYLNHITPSPNRDDPPEVDAIMNAIPPVRFLSPNDAYNANLTNHTSGYSSSGSESNNNSPRTTPRRAGTPLTCMTDLSQLVKRVTKVTITPETCV
ncbi:nicotinamide/nicotinic acid mononucleotide adenylyltransferase 1-like isoform X2 [Lineus longissimus]|uniref:nicotinamide/nicotinic acid mononucleotide adenylyltransferase 1-like isoform X2 n=1 Tax=Lineus longissimus TaxID=88925 RepID=UPI00315D2B4C